jgi:tRNA nucleotidyltransferase (CCA-adding enzyme)
MDVITTHINADFDCLGAMIGARRIYPEAHLVFAGSQERSLREFFLKSAVYSFNFERIRDIDLDQVTRLILVDVRQSSRIGPFEEVAKREGVDIHIYDHHLDGTTDLKGSVEYLEPVGATVTIFAHLFQERGISPTPDEATMMMLGLYEDTGNLLSTATTERDFQAAAFFLTHGASLNTVSDFLTREMTGEQVSLLHRLIRSRTIVNIEGVEICLAHASLDHFVGDIAVLAHKLKDMENLNALLVVVRVADRIFLVGRSRIPEVHVGHILSEFGGGGHSYAASATVRDLTLVQVMDRLPLILQKYVKRSHVVRDIMSTPVRTVDKGLSIEKAKTLMNRYNLNAMPVVENNGVVGIVSRQLVDKAVFHGLADVSVSEYMSGDFVSVTSDTPVKVLKNLILEGIQRFFPVIDNGQLVGALTRTDLLRHMVSGSEPAFGSGILNRGGGTIIFNKKQVSRLIRQQLSEKIADLLTSFGDVGDSLNVPVFVVGGIVRDLLLRKKNLDLDIVVDGDGIAFAAEFSRRHKCRIRSHSKFGTAVIIFPDGFKVDVASARLEYYLEPGALPQVENASIKIDLYRRDFTINTLAISLNRSRFGELLDFFGGQRDLRDRAIRVLHNLSFVEDPTRIFRAIRLEQRLGFQIGMHTESLLRSAVRTGFLKKVSGQRVFNELKIILKEEDPVSSLKRMASFEVLKFIHPALLFNDRVSSVFEEASKAIHWFELLYLEEKLTSWMVYFLCLTLNLDEDAMEGICSRFTVPRLYRKLFIDERVALHHVYNVMERRLTAEKKLRHSEIYFWLRPFSSELLIYGMACSRSEKVRKAISHYFSYLRAISPILDGHDLKKLGYQPGPGYQQILKAVLEARLDGHLESKKDEINFVEKTFNK